MSTDKSQIMKLVDKMPALSPNVYKIINMANHQATPHDQFIKEIETDPVITAKILGLVNSSYYAFPRPINKLSQAVMLLGYNTVKNIALSAAILKVRKDEGAIKDFNFDDVWTHMLGVAVAGREIAKAAGHARAVQDKVFISGLLHDLGEVVLMSHETEKYNKIVQFAREREKSIDATTRAALGFDSWNVGEAVAERWKLPDYLKTVMGNKEVEDVEDACIQHILTLANKYVMSKEIGHVVNQIGFIVTPEDLEKVGLTQEQLDQAIEDLPQKIDELMSFIKSS
ncbi:MAG: HDOD domain-containing protein [Planctomycetes bacterium]|nr:HDOD domain-containing protein [Planctomycetota bacterium]